MITAVNVHEAKTRFSQLLEQVQRGQDVVIAKAGRPVARLIPFQEPGGSIAPPGSLAGRGFWIADDFDDSVEEVFDSLRAVEE